MPDTAKALLLSSKVTQSTFDRRSVHQKMPLRPAGGFRLRTGFRYTSPLPSPTPPSCLIASHRSVTRSCPLPIEGLTSGSFLARLAGPDTPAGPVPAVPRWVRSCTGHTAHAAASHPILLQTLFNNFFVLIFAAQMIMQQGDEKFLRNLHIFHHYHHPVSVVSIVTVFYIVAKYRHNRHESSRPRIFQR